MNRRPRTVRNRKTGRRQRTRRPTIEELKFAASGLWPDIFYDAGGVPHEHLDGRGYPCVRCGGTDRFAAFKDVAERGSLQCRHCFNANTDPRPGDGIASLRWLLGCGTVPACQWLAGWLGLTDSVATPDPPPLRRSLTLRAPGGPDRQLSRFASDCHHAMRPAWWPRLEDHLNLPVPELKRLRVGWSAQYRATTWPMVDDNEHVIGLRLRCMKTGRKWSVAGGSAGLFLPVGLPVEIDRLFVTEGPTDCAALSSLGFACVGRPSCNGAVAITSKLAKRLHPSEAIIVADDDANGAGKLGAESLAVALVTVCPSVRIIYPPAGFNDTRDWVRGGATADDVLAIARAAAVRSLAIREAAE